MQKEHLEIVSAKVHDAWWEEKKKQGFHAPNKCQSKNHKSFQDADWRAKERFEDLHNPKFYKWCDKCHTDMYPYEELPENIKEYDRVTVRAVDKALVDSGYMLVYGDSDSNENRDERDR